MGENQEFRIEKMINSSYVIISFALISLYWICTVDASAGTLAKEYCRRDSLEIDGDAQAIISTVLAIREASLVDGNKPQRKITQNANMRTADHKRRPKEDTSFDVSPGTY